MDLSHFELKREEIYYGLGLKNGMIIVVMKYGDNFVARNGASPQRTSLCPLIARRGSPFRVVRDR